MTRNNIERKLRQEKLANLFFEMGMDLDLVEKMSGIDKKEFLSKKINNNKDIGIQLKLNGYSGGSSIDSYYRS